MLILIVFSTLMRMVYRAWSVVRIGTGFVLAGGMIAPVMAEKAAGNMTTEASPQPESKDTKTEKAEGKESPSYARKEAALRLREKENALERLLVKQQFDRRSEALTLKRAMQKKAEAEETLAYFNSFTKARMIAEAEMARKRAHDGVMYKTDELNELKKMYTEDQLTDSSEDIVMKRCIRDVEDAQFKADAQDVLTERKIRTLVPRDEVNLKTAIEEATLALEKLQAEVELNEKDRVLALDRARAEVEKAKEYLGK